MGGLARRATIIRDLRDDGNPQLIVDAGDLFFPRGALAGAGLQGTELEKASIRARTMVQGFNLIGTDAINIGHLDLAAGLPFLKSLADQAEFPLLSATLADNEGELIFKPYT